MVAGVQLSAGWQSAGSGLSSQLLVAGVLSTTFFFE